MKATKISAIAEAYRQAWQDSHGGERIIHCAGSYTGADWALATVVREITHAREVAWHPGAFLGHELAVVDVRGQQWRFEVQHPYDPAGCGCDRCLDIFTGFDAEQTISRSGT